MREFLEEIRNQPRRTRELMFVLCSVVTVSSIGLVWFKSFEKDLFVLINPEPDKQAQYFAARDQGTQSLFATLGQTGKNMQAAIGGLVNSINLGKSKSIPEPAANVSGSPHLLPISDYK